MKLQIVCLSLLLFSTLVNSCSHEFDSPTIQTTTGKLTGTTVKGSRFHVFQYLGVPFATAPVKDLRFQKTEPLPENPDADFDVRKFAPTCIQHKHKHEAINSLLNFDENQMMSEDCLYLNIYVPITNLSAAQKLPVMVWIPGEGFDFADARQFDGSYLASTANAIVITIQYRVGVFGFLKYGNFANGNMGLWDQITALRWVKRNINSFGGDDNLITVFGRFSGSMSISLLLTSPHLISENLYKRAIMMSGVAIESWIFDQQPEERADNYLKQLNCLYSDERCLEKMTAEELLEQSGYGWRPFVDNKLINEEPFSALKRGQFSHSVSDVLLGENQNEGTICLLPHLIGQTDYYKRFTNDEMNAEDFFTLTKADLKMFLGNKFPELHFYYENLIMKIFSEKSFQSIEEKYLKFCSFLLVNEPLQRFANLLTNEAWVSTFTYKLKYRPTFSNVFYQSNVFSGSIHGDDVLLLFALSNKTAIIHERDLNVSKVFIKAISNFVSNGAFEISEKEEKTFQKDFLLSQVTMKKKLSVRSTKMSNSTVVRPFISSAARKSCRNSRQTQKFNNVLHLNLQTKLNHLFAA